MSWLSFGIFCLTIFILHLPALNWICHCTRIFLNCSNPVHSCWLRWCSVGRERGECWAPQPSVSSECGAPQLSEGPCVCLSSIQVGIPRALVVLPSLTHLHFCVSCHHRLPHSWWVIAAAGASQVQQEGNQAGQCQQGTGTAAPQALPWLPSTDVDPKTRSETGIKVMWICLCVILFWNNKTVCAVCRTHRRQLFQSVIYFRDVYLSPTGGCEHHWF